MVKVNVLPGEGYLLGQAGLHASYGIACHGQRHPQVLSLDWGYLDPTDSSWESGKAGLLHGK